MLNYIQSAQTISLLALTQVIMWSRKVTSFGSKEWDKSVTHVALIITAFFHFFLIYYQTTPLLYFWFISSMVHYFIHSHKVRRTIVESKDYMIDEVWHLSNQLLSVYYMYTNNASYPCIVIHFTALSVYFFFLALKAYGIAFNGTMYILGSFLAPFFIFSLRANYSLYLLPFIILHTSISACITYKNPLGRRLLLLNIPGASFISEAIVLHLLHNNLI